jgi:ABC-type Fe3+-citrate transport system substrate-binding protein
MRALLSKMMTGTMIAGAALLVSACGGSDTANTAENTAMTDLNAMAPMEGTVNDMTVVDSAAMDANAAMDVNAADANATSENATTNAM